MTTAVETAYFRPSRVTAGSLLSNNDPRVAGYKRLVSVTEVGRDETTGEWFAFYQSGTRRAKINLRRIFLDGKKRAQGYNLLPSPPQGSDPA